MDPAFLFVLFALGVAICIPILGITEVFGLGEYYRDHRRWRIRGKELEAERILGYVDNRQDDKWLARMEARIQAHGIQEPDAPGWAFWLSKPGNPA